MRLPGSKINSEFLFKSFLGLIGSVECLADQNRAFQSESVGTCVSFSMFVFFGVGTGLAEWVDTLSKESIFVSINFPFLPNNRWWKCVKFYP